MIPSLRSSSRFLLPHLVQQRRAVPGRAVEDGGGVGGGAHWPELLVELLLPHLLGLVYLQEDVGGGPHDPGRRLGAEEELACLSHPDGIRRLRGPEPLVPGVVQPVPETTDAVEELRDVGGRCLDQVATLCHEEGEEQQLQLR